MAQISIDYISQQEFFEQYMGSPKKENCFDDYRRFIKYRREVIYNALGLMQNQIQEFENCIEKSDDIVAEKIQEYINAAYELKLLKCSCAPLKDINDQKKILKNIKNEIEKIHKSQIEEFKHLLNHEQRSKYSMIKKLERANMHHFIFPKDYYKTNPKMSPFGDPALGYENIK